MKPSDCEQYPNCLEACLLPRYMNVFSKPPACFIEKKKEDGPPKTIEEATSETLDESISQLELIKRAYEVLEAHREEIVTLYNEIATMMLLWKTCCDCEAPARCDADSEIKYYFEHGEFRCQTLTDVMKRALEPQG